MSSSRHGGCSLVNSDLAGGKAGQKKTARGLRQRGSDYRCCIPALAGFVSPQSIAPDGEATSCEPGMDAIGERAKIRNSNIEIRNNFEAQSSKSKKMARPDTCFEHSNFRRFGFVSTFVIRISNLFPEGTQSPSSSRCQATSSVSARPGSAAIPSSALRGAIKAGSIANSLA